MDLWVAIVALFSSLNAVAGGGPSCPFTPIQSIEYFMDYKCKTTREDERRRPDAVLYKDNYLCALDQKFFKVERVYGVFDLTDPDPCYTEVSLELDCGSQRPIELFVAALDGNYFKCEPRATRTVCSSRPSYNGNVENFFILENHPEGKRCKAKALITNGSYKSNGVPIGQKPEEAWKLPL